MSARTMLRSNISRGALLLGAAALMALAGSTVGACNSQGSCPAKESIQPGGACSDDELQCAYDVTTPAAACDGTNTTVATSCICTSGAWACPSPYSCEGGAAAEAGDDGGGEGGDDGGGGEASSDAPPG